jgi:uncharacterized protein (TIGR03435 family)
MRCMAAVVAACLLAAGGAGGAEAPPYAQAPPSPAAQFEVAAIRRNTSPDDEGSIGSQPNGRFVVRNVPLRFIIQVVHELPAFRVTGGPDWLDTERWDIQAKAAEAVPESRLHAMMRALLADRFKLTTRSETRGTSGFALVRARANGPLGPQLRAHPEPCPPEPPPTGAPVAIDALPSCGKMSGSDRLIRMSARPLTDLATILSRRVARPVVDRTALTGLFDVELRWTADARSSAPLAQAPAAPDDGVSLFTALQEQLGLRLQSARVDTEFLVIDRVERPTED